MILYIDFESVFFPGEANPRFIVGKKLGYETFIDIKGERDHTTLGRRLSP